MLIKKTDKQRELEEKENLKNSQNSLNNKPVTNSSQEVLNQEKEIQNNFVEQKATRQNNINTFDNEQSDISPSDVQNPNTDIQSQEELKIGNIKQVQTSSNKQNPENHSKAKKLSNQTSKDIYDLLEKTGSSQINIISASNCISYVKDQNRAMQLQIQNNKMQTSSPVNQYENTQMFYQQGQTEDLDTNSQINQQDLNNVNQEKDNYEYKDNSNFKNPNKKIPLIKSIKKKNDYYNSSGVKSTIPSYPSNQPKKPSKKDMYAGFWIRFLAFFIDYMIVLGIKNIFSYFLPFKLDPIFSKFVFVIIFTLYSFIMVFFTNGQTIGKLFLNIKIVSDNSDKIGFFTALTREVVGKFIILKTYVIPIFLILSDKKHHLIDYLSDTSVIKEKYQDMYEELKSNDELQ